MAKPTGGLLFAKRMFVGGTFFFGGLTFMNSISGKGIWWLWRSHPDISINSAVWAIACGFGWWKTSRSLRKNKEESVKPADADKEN